MTPTSKQVAEKESNYFWYWINDTEKRPDGVQGSILRYGRFYLHSARRKLFHASWCFSLKIKAELSLVLRLDLEDGAVFHFGFMNLASFWIGLGVPMRWLELWMLDDRVFGVRFGYIGDIAWIDIAHNEWGVDCGMIDYYRRENPRRHTDLQLWEGWQFKVRWPPVLDWMFGRAKTDSVILSVTSVKVPIDGKIFDATIKKERYETRRPRWPFPYRVRFSSWIDVPNPPQFAGKGENSWDCGDDGIWGMGSVSMNEATVVGEYITRVLENRKRYGNAREA